MSAAVGMPKYRVINALMNAISSAFDFSTHKTMQMNISKHYNKRLIDIGGNISATWAIMTIFALMAAISLAVFSAFNAQVAIASFIDPMGKGNVVPTWVILFIGSAITIFGMILGHLIYEGFTEGIDRDEYTGITVYNIKFRIGCICLLGACLYVFFQYTLVKTASNGVDSPEFIGLKYLPTIILGIAVIELLVGVLILHIVFSYIMLFMTGLRLKSRTRRMNAAARMTNDRYRQYLGFVDVYNTENPTNPLQREGNQNIISAIAYYSGSDLNEVSIIPNTENPGNSDQNDTPRQLTGQPTTTQDSGEQNSQKHQIRSEEQANRDNGNNSSNNPNPDDARRIVDDFMNDSTNEDLTV